MELNVVLNARLQELDAQKLRRRLRTVETFEPPWVTVAGRRCLNFSSNDYLGLATHPRLRERLEADAARRENGSGASRLICGNRLAHETLDSALATFKQTEAALAFSSGYAAALGTIPALVGRGDLIIADRLAHACLIDAARLSGADLRVFRHNDLEDLEDLLRKRPASGQVLIVTESVFSMDGDCAPLRALVELKERYGAWLMVDEAHSTGLYGEGGCGLVQAERLGGRVEVQMGTLGKALGVGGGFIVGSAVLREYLINRARSFIFSTAPAPLLAEAAYTAIQLVQSSEGDALRQKLWARTTQFQGGLAEFASPFSSAIFPIRLGSEERALVAAEKLLEQGFLAPAVRYPTVRRGEARLRVTLSAVHSAEQIDLLLEALRSL